MDRWVIFGMVVAGGFGALTFLRIVGHELVVKNQEIEVTAQRARDEIKKRLEAEEQERIHEVLESKRTAKKSA